MYTLLDITETSEPASTDLTTLEAVKLELGITDSSEDDALNGRIDRASAIIADWCDRRFAFADAVETFIFDGWQGTVFWGPFKLYLSCYPIAEIISVTIDGAELAASAYDVRADQGLVIFPSGIAATRIIVTYTGGYDLPNESPPTLQQACIELIRNQRSNAMTSSRDAGIREIDHGDTRVIFNQASTATATTTSAALPIAVTELLSQFKRPALA